MKRLTEKVTSLKAQQRNYYQSLNATKRQNRIGEPSEYEQTMRIASPPTKNTYPKDLETEIISVQ